MPKNRISDAERLKPISDSYSSPQKTYIIILKKVSFF